MKERRSDGATKRRRGRAAGVAARVMLSWLVFVASLAFGTRAMGQDEPIALDDALAMAAQYELGASRRPLAAIEAVVFRVAGDETERAAVEHRLLELLERTDATLACRSFVCRQLAIIGSGASVPALARLLGDEALAHMARYALEAIPGPDATRVLEEAAAELDGDLGVGAANSVQRRLARAAGSDEPALVAAQLWQRYAEPRADHAGDHERYAALREWSRLRPAEAAPVLAHLLYSTSSFWRGSAARLIVELPGPAATRACAAMLEDMDADAQVRLIDALARRGDRVARDAVTDLLRSDNADVQDAVLEALVTIGGPEDVPALVELAAAGDAAAADTLVRLRVEDAERVIARAAGEASDAERVVIVQTLGGRRAHSQRAAVVGLASEGQPSEVRTAALLALQALDADRGGASSSQLFGRAMEAASGPEEMRWVLAALETRGHMAQVPLAMRWLEDDAVGPEAARVVITLARTAETDETDDAISVIEQVVAAYPDDTDLRRDAGEAVGHVDRNEGFIRRWAVAGPFTQAETDASGLFDVAFAPEPDGPSADFTWRAVAPEELAAPGIVDLKLILGGDTRVGYVCTIIRTERDRDARLEIGSDDGVKVWLNGEVVHANNAMRGLTAGQDVVPVTLREGSNTLLLKITQGGGDWRVCCRLRDADGFRFGPVSFEMPR